MKRSACPSQLKTRGKTAAKELAPKSNEIYDENLANDNGNDDEVEKEGNDDGNNLSEKGKQNEESDEDSSSSDSDSDDNGNKDSDNHDSDQGGSPQKLIDLDRIENDQEFYGTLSVVDFIKFCVEGDGMTDE